MLIDVCVCVCVCVCASVLLCECVCVRSCMHRRVCDNVIMYVHDVGWAVSSWETRNYLNNAPNRQSPPPCSNELLQSLSSYHAWPALTTTRHTQARTHARTHARARAHIHSLIFLHMNEQASARHLRARLWHVRQTLVHV